MGQRVNQNKEFFKMTEEDFQTLRRYEEVLEEQKRARLVEQLTSTCSPDQVEFWRPRPGLRLAFGCTESEDGSLRSPAYVIEFTREDGEGWMISLIWSRDPEIATGDGCLALPLSTFHGRAPKCSSEMSPIQQRLWQKLYEYFKQHKHHQPPGRRRRQR